MFKRLNELNFVIGLFFTIAAFILLIDYFTSNHVLGKINLYTGISFLIFGILMIGIRTNKNAD
ncbi:MAG TPA: hypothetical protein VGI82_08445 [Chitinophagaceae bacterium]|jgi:hypothetical protein